MSDVKPMALSTAIRLGAMLKPQAFEEFFKNGGSCALGAAADACHIDVSRGVCTPFMDYWPWLGLRALCPRCSNHSGRFVDLVYHLNDSHGWTREQIADWVQTQEEHLAAVDGTKVLTACDA